MPRGHGRIALVVAVVIGWGDGAFAQISSERAILERAAATIQKAEPAMRSVTAGDCSCPRIVNEQLGSAVGVWTDKGSINSFVVFVYGIATEDSAAAVLMRQARGEADSTWKATRFTPYTLGDGANIGVTSSLDGSSRYRLIFRRGRFLVDMTALSRELLERFAPYVLTAASAEP
jgi:hypothetical protein